jgi:hypothetical protein
MLIEEQIETFAQEFIDKYFGKTATEYYWIGEEIGGVMAINDYFFDFDSMLQFMRHKYSRKKMFEYYDYALELNMANESPINIKNYVSRK